MLYDFIHLWLDFYRYTRLEIKSAVDKEGLFFERIVSVEVISKVIGQAAKHLYKGDERVNNAILYIMHCFQCSRGEGKEC